MTYWYFVAYDYYGPNDIGSGNTEVSTNIPITSIKHIREIELTLFQDLKARNPRAGKLLLTSYQLLRTEDSEP